MSGTKDPDSDYQWTGERCSDEYKLTMKKNTPSVPRVTPKYLVAHGFKEMPGEASVFMREHVRLDDVLGDLGVPLASLRPTVNQPAHSDVRTAHFNGLYVLVRSEVRDRKGRIVEHSLDGPDAICTVQISFQGPKHEYLKTDSSPRMHIKSVLVPEDHSKPLQVDFELRAAGKKPVAILQSNFHVYLAGGSIPPHTGLDSSFPEKTPQIIIVSSGKPAVFRLSVPVDLFVRLVAGRICFAHSYWRNQEGRTPTVRLRVGGPGTLVQRVQVHCQRRVRKRGQNYFRSPGTD